MWAPIKYDGFRRIFISGGIRRADVEEGEARVTGKAQEQEKLMINAMVVMEINVLSEDGTALPRSIRPCYPGEELNNWWSMTLATPEREKTM